MQISNSNSVDRPIIFFDGVCNLCNVTVNLLMGISPRPKLYYATLQGKTAQNCLDPQVIEKKSSIIFFKQGQTKVKGQAIIAILDELGSFYGFFASILRPCPKWLLDIAYSIVADNRYFLFGKKDYCRLPTEEERSYFLD